MKKNKEACGVVKIYNGPIIKDLTRKSPRQYIFISPSVMLSKSKNQQFLSILCSKGNMLVFLFFHLYLAKYFE